MGGGKGGVGGGETAQQQKPLEESESVRRKETKQKKVKEEKQMVQRVPRRCWKKFNLKKQTLHKRRTGEKKTGCRGRGGGEEPSRSKIRLEFPIIRGPGQKHSMEKEDEKKQ